MCFDSTMLEECIFRRFLFFLPPSTPCKNSVYIYFINTDKGTTNVAMNEAKYIQEATLMLRDEKT